MTETEDRLKMTEVRFEMTEVRLFCPSLLSVFCYLSVFCSLGV